MEGTPDHPGPAVAPGSPCSYTPTPKDGSAAGQSAAVRRSRPDRRALWPAIGPRAPAWLRPNVMTSPPQPHGLPPTPGIPIAGRPGVPPPTSLAPRCRCRPMRRRARVPNRSDRPVPPRPHRPSHRGSRQARLHHRGPAPAASHRSSPRWNGRQQANEHHLQYPVTLRLPHVSRAAVDRRTRRWSRRPHHRGRSAGSSTRS